MATKPKDPETPETAAAPALPTISVMERRMRDGGTIVFRPSNIELQHQSEPMTVRTINTEIRGRFWHVVQRLGWTPVTPEEIVGGLPQGDLRAQNGQVVLGEGGKEIVMKASARQYQALQRQRETAHDKKMRSKKAILSRAQQNAASDGREEVADRIGGMTLTELEVTRGPDY